jgi:hypothetical protein
MAFSIPLAGVPAELRQPLATAVGEMVIQWGMLEAAVNRLIALIYGETGGKRGARLIPYSFAPKLRFLRHSFAQIAALKTYQNRSARLINRAMELSHARNAIVHGSVSGFNPKTVRVRFMRLESDGQTQHEKHADFSIAELHTLANECLAVANELQPFLTRVAHRLTADIN